MSTRINVLSFRNTIVDGGPEKAILQWYEHIDKQKFSYQLASFDNPGGVQARLVDRARAVGMQTHLIPWGRRKRMIAAVRAVVRIVREQNIHIIQSHDAKCDVVSWLAARITNTPVVGAAYGWFGNRSQFRVRIYEWLDVRLLNQFQAIVSPSRSLVEESIATGIRPDLLNVVYVGIDCHNFQVGRDEALRRQLGLAPGDFALVNLARLWPEKGQTYLLTALQAVVKKFPQTKLLMVGDGPMKPELQALARQLGLEQHVIWVPFPDSLPALLACVDLQVHSSIYEGLPMAILSGMAAGLPILTTDVGGVSEVIANGRTGLLVPPKDTAALAEGLMLLLSRPDLAQRLGAAARKSVQQNYHSSAGARSLENIFERLFEARYQSSRAEQVLS